MDAPNKPYWVERIHALGDDCMHEDKVLLAELAVLLTEWPVTNPVAARALQAASVQLLEIASREELPVAP